MTIAARPLQTVEDLRSAVELQQLVLGGSDPAIWRLPHLSHAQQSGGVLLGAYESSPSMPETLDGALVDLLAVMEGYSACRTAVWCVSPQSRNCGIGSMLRLIERKTLQQEGVDVVFWDADPLDGISLHITLNKLGGILTGYSQDTLGSTRDSRALGMATDRVRCEWWIDAPSVTNLLDRGRTAPHQHIGLHEMDVLTKTTFLPSGIRGLVDVDDNPTAKHVLVEIPENSDDLQARDHDAAIQWRLRSRDLIKRLFVQAYLGIGLIHEGGRSFLLFKKGTRRTELGSDERS